MHTPEEPNAPKTQHIADAPHGGRNKEGEIVADSTESADQGSAWEASGELTPENSDETGIDGYESGPGNFQRIPDNE